jgi:hypothetical protein
MKNSSLYRGINAESTEETNLRRCWTVLVDRILLPDRIDVAIAVRLDLDLSYRSGPDAWLWAEISNRVQRHAPEG